ncbi:guanylate kinase [Gammaproteobacteria bacterium]|nr:guanylate kinase [Gammaproteobacteria bacterium]
MTSPMTMNESYGNLYVVSSPSGGGKTTLVSQLLECTPDLMRAITHTTRPPRPDEKNGVHYHFVNPDEFALLIDNDGFLESAQVFKNQYGTSKKEVVSKLKRGMDVVLVIDWQGAQQVRIKEPNAITIFILPPSIDALRARLLTRNQDSFSVVETRMEDAVTQISHYVDFDYLLINDDFDMALAQLRAIIMAQRLRNNRQTLKHKELINALIDD